MGKTIYAKRPRDYARAFGKYIQEGLATPAAAPHVVMMHVGRSGSTVLGDTLDQRPDLHWDNEIFMAKRLGKYAPLLPFLRPWISGNAVRAVHWRMLLAVKPVFGFEVMPHQLERYEMTLETLVEKIEPLGFQHLVLLERKNTLRIIVSQYRAVELAHWHTRDTESRQKPAVHLPINDVFGYGRSLIENLDYYASFAPRTKQSLVDKRLLHLTYEDDIAADPLVAYQKCCKFLGLPDYDSVSVRMRKINPNKLPDLLTNYDEVAQELRGTQYEWMLSD